MALKIENGQIVGTIDKLEEKLEGKLPVTREELLFLIKSWGEIYNYDQPVINVGSCYDLSKLDVSQITDMSYLFKNSPFDGDIGNWDVSSVTNMLDMFSFAKEFNSPLNDWDVSKVTSMAGMFYGSKKINSDIGKWEVSNVIDMSYMFAYTKEFNQNISSWNINNVVNMGSMFSDAKSFNQNISSWNLDNVKNSYFMFNKAKAFCDKYNNGNPLPEDTYKTKEWFNLNRERINMIEIKEKHGEEIDNFFSIINNNEIKKDK